MLTGVDLGNYGWVPQVPFTQGATIPLYVSDFSDPFASPHFLNADVVNDPHMWNWQDAGSVCCAFQESFLGHPGSTVVTGNTSGTPWAPGNNPYGGTTEVVIGNDLVIDNSIDLYVENMTLRFAPTARLVIKPGAYARFKNCVLTSYTCDNARWRGVRVEGNTNLDQSDQTDAQGRLYLDHTTVSNAQIGVRCAKETFGSNVDPNGYGGVLWTYYATFKNNLIGVDLGHYHHHFNQYGVEDNRTYLHYTTFVTDNDWPDSYLPSNHAQVFDTRKVNFILCTFANDATSAPLAGQGNGLYTYKAEVYVKGSSTNPTYGFVRNLRTGIKKEGGPLEPITVDRMRFSGNWTGIDDVAGHFSRYINNLFNVPDVTSLSRYGMKLNQSRFFTVERNTFTGSVQAMNNNHRSVGIWFLGINPDQTLPWNYDDEQIYDNDFTDLHTGCLVNRMHRSADGGPNDSGLQIYCGDYLNNTEDIGVGPRSIIRPNQFKVGFEPQLAGNRFLDEANCTSNYDWILDEFWNTDVAPYEGMSVIYHRLNDPVCAAICPTEQDDQFDDQPVGFPASFDEEVDCGGGKLDQGRSRSQAEAAYAAARTLCVQAKALLDGSTDGGNRPDLLAELTQDHPWLGTGFLRDRLLLNSPLSNEALRAMIEREQPMDPWHITQVCIENSPLDPGILGLLKDNPVMGDFFHNIVLQAQEGLGPSAKQLLQEEYMLRRGQQAQALADVGWLWATDTISPGGEDSLRNTMEHAAGLDHRWARMARRLFAGDMTGANNLEGDLRGQNGFAQLQAVIDMGTAHGGDWFLLDSVEVDSMVAYALLGVQGAAMYESILEGHNLADVYIEAVFPDKFRSMHAGQEDTARDDATYAITAYPTPADNEAWLTYAVELSGGGYRIEDAQGKVVQQGRFASGGLMPLSTADLATGMYAVVAEHNAAKGRLFVKH
ncbi:MAG: hypothetical protein KA791_05430 [Flavobacteriales bacterium]|nr:hypothetical protein [Flavobacteriales bacterium]